MQTNKVSLSVLGVLVIAVLLFVGVLKIQQVYAQADATSTESVDSMAPTVDALPASSTEEVVVEQPGEAEASTGMVAGAATSDSAVTETQTTSAAESSPTTVTATETPPEGLTEVHIIGTKYTDYFTDGTTVTSYPGDPEIHAHIREPNAPIPTHEGLRWLYSNGDNLYDTVSGNLEEGEYAVQSNGSIIAKQPPFVSSTSTPAVLGETTSTEVTPPDTSSTSTTTAEPSDPSAPATTTNQ